MKIFKAKEVREADAFTIKHEPISSIDLMERAAQKVSDWIRNKYTKDKYIAILVGSGNNGGDGLVIARHLLNDNYKIKVFDLKTSSNYSKDFLINKQRLENIDRNIISKFDQKIDLNKFDILIDAILGSGLTRPIENPLAEKIKQINLSKVKSIAIDIPSGLFGENNSENIYQNIIKANYTLSFQFPKLSFLFPENSEFVGKIKVLDIGVHPKYIADTKTNFFLTQKEDISTEFLDRKLFSHKGTYGHALLFTGSHGKMGASILATKACLRSGAGLVSALIHEDENLILQAAVPEVMTFPISDFSNIPKLQNFSTIGLGPGIGQSKFSLEILTSILNQFQKPLVLDADALNLLALNPELLKKIPKNSILTPHPKELERLIGKSKNDYSRLFKTQAISQKYEIYILIKGAYSTIVCPDGTFYFNSTGNPGMATAGSGDVLTGIVTGLLIQGLNSFEALKTGVYIHGLAGDIAKKEQGELSLIASDIINNIGNALLTLK